MSRTAWHLDRGQLLTTVGGGGTPEVMAMLADVQLSRHLLLLRGLLDTVEDEAASIAHLWDNFRVLCAIERENSRQIARLLAHPLVGAWLTTCLRRVMSGDRQDQPNPLWVDLGHLGGVVVAAAIRSKVEVEAAVPSRRGVVAIPTIGCLRTGNTSGWHMTEVRRLANGTLTITSGCRVIVVPEGRLGEDADQWPVRRLRVTCEGVTLEVELDDVDPYRNPYLLQTAHRLMGDEVSEWERLLSEAWTILVTRHRDAADSIARGLRTLVPLAITGTGWASSTSRHAPAAVALTHPSNGRNLACTLVHEFQHTKLNLITDISPLHRGSSGGLFYSPWRDDPRPLMGLLHGLSAGIAMANFWRVEYQAGQLGTVAAFEFARIRRQIQDTLHSLAGNDSLTESGAALIDAMEEVIPSWNNINIPARIQILADDLALCHAVRWKLRNLRPRNSDATHLAAIWRSGSSAKLVASESVLHHRDDVFSSDPLLRLAYAFLHKNGTFLVNQTGPSTDMHVATSPDFCILSGRYSEAASAYEAEIVKGEHTIEAWAGLAISLSRLFGRKAHGIISRPELVRAVYETLANGDGPMPSPRDLAHWLAAVTG